MGRPLPKDHKHEIKLPEAAKMARRQREERDPKKRGMERPYAFRREALERILAQPGCDGVRVYPGVHEDGSPGVVLVGVDENGDDMVNGVLLQDSIACPPFCSDKNELNSDR